VHVKPFGWDDLRDLALLILWCNVFGLFGPISFSLLAASGLIIQSEDLSVDVNHGSDALIFSIYIFVLRYNLRYDPSCT